MVHLEANLEDDEDYRCALEQLSAESKKLKNLQESGALKAASRCHRKDLEEIKARAQQTQNELMELMLKVKKFNGEILKCRRKLKLFS